MLELFKGYKVGIKETCEVEILTNTVLPQPIGVSDEVWSVVTQIQIDLSRVFGRENYDRSKAESPQWNLIELPLGCSAICLSLYFPSYSQTRDKYGEKDSSEKLIEIRLNNWSELWESMVEKFPEVILKQMPKFFKAGREN